MRREKYGLGDPSQRVKQVKNSRTRVNICWHVGEERKCVTLDKSDAYATREWVEERGGVVYWFQALPD